ncbi:MAG: efflux RND transporter periplasmic adaptor subunit [Betaproteobacteria bacterium]
MRIAAPSAVAAVMLIGAAGALSFTACDGPPPPGSAEAAAAGLTPKAAYFTVAPDQMKHVGVVPARLTTWTTDVRTTGTVDWDNDQTTQAITQVSGPVTRIVVDLGTRVKAGDPLLYVASADVATAMSNYRKAKNRLDLAQRTLTRSRDLLAHKALSQSEMDGVEADFNDAATDLQTTMQALKIYGVSAKDLEQAEQQNVAIRPELAMRAPIAGTVVQKLVLPGQFIQAGATTAFVISNVSTVWVQGHLYDKDLSRVHVGDTADVRQSALPVVFHGTVSYIGEMLDPATRTTPVRIVTRNTDGLLKKDLFVDVILHNRTRQNVLVVPTAAVLYDENNMPFVYVQMEPGKFAQRLVTLGAQQDDETQIADGLKAGDAVVGQGSVFLQFANTYGQ